MTPGITPEGDIYLHNKGGIVADVNFTDDTTGAAKDMSAKTVAFIASDGTRIVMTNGTSTDVKVLTIPQGALSGLIGKTASFAVVDESSTPHRVEWSGRLMVAGF